MKWRKRGLILAGVAFLNISSYGPVVGYFLMNNPKPNPAIEVAAMVIYSPLALMVYLCPPLRRPLNWYSDLFCPRLDDADPGP